MDQKEHFLHWREEIDVVELEGITWMDFCCPMNIEVMPVTLGTQDPENKSMCLLSWSLQFNHGRWKNLTWSIVAFIRAGVWHEGILAKSGGAPKQSLTYPSSLDLWLLLCYNKSWKTICRDTMAENTCPGPLRKRLLNSDKKSDEEVVSLEGEGKASSETDPSRNPRW